MVRHFVVVTRAQSGARIREGQALQLRVLTSVGPATATVRTRYADEGLESPIPRELWVEIQGDANSSLDEAINAYWSSANGLLPSFAVIANAPIEDVDIHIAFDATPGETEHAFFENFLPDEGGRPRHGRSMPLPETLEVLEALAESDERPRLARACAFYREALGHLKPGREVLQVVFLWMAVEALTKVALHRACAAEGCTEDELLVRWGLAPAGAEADIVRVAKRGLDGEARRRLIFHGDADCQRVAAQASNGFEHGFEEFSRVRELALEAKERKVAEHVRQALFELLQLPGSTACTLIGGRYEKPRANWLINRYLRGTFVGQADSLAAPDQEYPIIRWEGRLSRFRRNENGTHTISFNDDATVVCGEGVEFRPKSHEVWGPENDPLEPQG
jgi:hypothetical protein